MPISSAGETRAQRKRRRERERLERIQGPPGYQDHVRSLPCVRCQALGLTQTTPTEPHHDPTVGAGGTWRDQSPVCTDCHTMGPGARHTVGVLTFWDEVGTTYEQANRRTYESWASDEGLGR